MGASTPGMPNALGFAPCRRGALNSYEICFADQKRALGISWQHIAQQLGRSVEDVRRFCEVQPASTTPAPPMLRSTTPHDRYLLKQVEKKHINASQCAFLMGETDEMIDRLLASRAEARTRGIEL